MDGAGLAVHSELEAAIVERPELGDQPLGMAAQLVGERPLRKRHQPRARILEAALLAIGLRTFGSCSKS